MRYAKLCQRFTKEQVQQLQDAIKADAEKKVRAGLLMAAIAKKNEFKVEFSPFDGPDYARALDLAKGAAEFRDLGTGRTLRHRARFFPPEAVKLRELFEIVGRFDSTDVLVDDKPVPYARELWLPLVWFLIR